MMLMLFEITDGKITSKIHHLDRVWDAALARLIKTSELSKSKMLQYAGNLIQQVVDVFIRTLFCI